MAKATKNMHVPAYAPPLVGIQSAEKSGVLWLSVKTIEGIDVPDPDEELPMSIATVVSDAPVCYANLSSRAATYRGGTSTSGPVV